jgi:hypothetical protein
MLLNSWTRILQNLFSQRPLTRCVARRRIQPPRIAGYFGELWVTTRGVAHRRSPIQSCFVGAAESLEERRLLSAGAQGVDHVAPTLSKVVVVPSINPSSVNFEVNIVDPSSTDKLTYSWTVDGVSLDPTLTSNHGQPTTSRLDIATIPVGNHTIRLHVVDDAGTAVDFSTLEMSGNGTLAPTEYQPA